MEEKEITEQESLALISQMIKKTNKQMRIGSGDFLLAWGWLIFIVSLIVALLVMYTNQGMYMWGYFAIFVIGDLIERYRVHKNKTDKIHVKTYMEDVINKVWSYVSLILYMACGVSFALGYNHPKAWLGMWVLGMLLPAIGSGITGLLLRVKKVNYSVIVAVFVSLFCISILYSDKLMAIPMLFLLVYPFVTIFSMIIPGYLINSQAKRLNEE